MITTTMMHLAETVCDVLLMWVFPKSPFYPLNPFCDCIIRTLLWFYTDEPINRIFPVNIDHSISFTLLSQCSFHIIRFNKTNWHNLYLFVGIVFMWIELSSSIIENKSFPFLFSFSFLSFSLFNYCMYDISNISFFSFFNANLVSGNCLSNNFYFIIFYSHFSTNNQSFILVFPIHYSNSIVSL